jgi:hypothetical protein
MPFKVVSQPKESRIKVRLHLFVGYRTMAIAKVYFNTGKSKFAAPQFSKIAYVRLFPLFASEDIIPIVPFPG